MHALPTARLPQCKQDIRRQRTLELMRAITEAGSGGQAPALQVEKRLVTVPENSLQKVTVTNTSSSPLHFAVACPDEPPGSTLLATALPNWLELIPARGTVPAHGSIQLRVQASAACLKQEFAGFTGGGLRRGAPVRATLALVAHSDATANNGWAARSMRSPACLFQVVLSPKGGS